MPVLLLLFNQNFSVPNVTYAETAASSSFCLLKLTWIFWLFVGSESSDNDNQKTENIRINTFRNSITYGNLKSVNNYKSTNNKKRRRQRVSFVDNDVIEVKEFFAY